MHVRAAALVPVALALVVLGSVAPRTQAAPPRSVSLTAIQMLTPSTGWAQSSCRILHTSSGVGMWRDVTPRSIPCRTNSAPSGPATAFLDANHAWVALVTPATTARGMALVSVAGTANGGRTWGAWPFRFHGPTESILSLDFTDPSHGWMFLVQGIGAGQMQFVIFHTRNGGRRWFAVSSSGIYANSRTLPSCDCTNAITFHGQSRGWATGNAFARPNDVYFYTTRDAGRTWRPQPLGIPAAGRLAVQTYPPTFFGPRTGLLPVQTAAFKRFTVYSTADGGNTWHPTTAVPTGSAGSALTVSFADPRHGWFTNGAKLFRTSDGGHHWVHIPTNVSLQPLTQLEFVTDSVGYALVTAPGSGRMRPFILRTRDGGHTWSSVLTTAHA